ncbi:hypothetical protein CH292_05320 [Rhodococcus sp. 14-2470-1a]|nr:hypothetical protein CH292_05320 [Rhodococcus sp. 14-2470-1a]
MTRIGASDAAVGTSRGATSHRMIDPEIRYTSTDRRSPLQRKAQKMSPLLQVGFDLLGYAATIVVEGIRLLSPGIRYG